MKKERNITLSELAEAISAMSNDIKEKEIESIGVNSRRQFVIRFTDYSEAYVKAIKVKEG